MRDFLSAGLDNLHDQNFTIVRLLNSHFELALGFYYLFLFICFLIILYPFFYKD